MKIFTLTQDPRFDSLRSYREFQKIIDHLGLNYPLSMVSCPRVSHRAAES